MFETRNLYVNTFAAYNGGSQARYWSIGYYTAEGAQQCDETWVEIDSLPGDSAWSEVEEYLRSLNTPASQEKEQEPTSASRYFAVGSSVYHQEAGSTEASLFQGPCYNAEKAQELAAWLNEEASREASMATVHVDQAPEAGLLLWQAGDTGRFFVSAELGNCRSFLSAPYRTQEEAMAELRRVAPMYPGLAWYRLAR